MNLLKLQSGNDYIELSATRYEFEECKDSIEWLMLYGKICVRGTTLEGEDPTIETTDFDFLKAWAKEKFLKRSAKKQIGKALLNGVMRLCTISPKENRKSSRATWHDFKTVLSKTKWNVKNHFLHSILFYLFNNSKSRFTSDSSASIVFLSRRFCI